MAAPPTKIIYVKWTDWEQGQTFMTDMNTQVRVARAAIPIIFVPGIMGSRLKGAGKGGGRAWDPDDLPFMLKSFYNATGAEREKLLITPQLEVNEKDAGGQPTFSFRERMQMNYSIVTEYASVSAPPNWDWLGLPPAMDADQRLAKTIDLLIDHGWDQIAWGFYGDVLTKLAEGHFSELSRCFVHPVYAFGYNWIANNQDAGAKLAARITQIITNENYANHPCDKVILVSHSMGGLVTRSCVINEKGVADKVMGIIHGAQPATGAPAAYRRMRAGFEGPNSNIVKNFVAGITNRVMGLDDSRVVPILAKCVGGLELLPTMFYKTNAGSKQWLTMSAKGGQQAAALPYGDPYGDIYQSESTAKHTLSNDEAFLQLIPHPALLSPAPGGGKTVNRYAQANGDALKTFQTNLGTAKGFHAGLKLSVHPNTYVAYTGHKGPKTYDKVHFSYLRDQNEQITGVTVTEAGGFPYSYAAPPEQEGTGIDLNEHPPGGGSPQYFTLDPQDGNGDGTVPVSSSRALIDENANVKSNNATVRDDKGKLVPADIASVEHGAFFSNADALNFTLMAIRQLDWKYRLEKIGR